MTPDKPTTVIPESNRIDNIQNNITSCNNPNCDSTEFTVEEVIYHVAKIDPDDKILYITDETESDIVNIECIYCETQHVNSDFEGVEFY